MRDNSYHRESQHIVHRGPHEKILILEIKGAPPNANAYKHVDPGSGTQTSTLHIYWPYERPPRSDLAIKNITRHTHVPKSPPIMAAIADHAAGKVAPAATAWAREKSDPAVTFPILACHIAAQDPGPYQMMWSVDNLRNEPLIIPPESKPATLSTDLAVTGAKMIPRTAPEPIVVNEAATTIIREPRLCEIVEG